MRKNRTFQKSQVLLSLTLFPLGQWSSEVLQGNSTVRFELSNSRYVKTLSFYLILRRSKLLSQILKFLRCHKFPLGQGKSGKSRGNSKTRFGFSGSKSIGVVYSHVKFIPLFFVGLRNLLKNISRTLQKSVGLTEFYIKDSWNFEHKINNLNIPKNFTIISLDIISMYTNITQGLIVKSIKKN